MESNKEQTCCFSGYRPEKMPQLNMQSTTIPEEIYEPLMRALRTACAAGCTRFLTGMSRGFDLWAAQAVIILRREAPVSLYCVMPYNGQETHWEAPWIEVHHAVQSRAEGVTVLAPCYARDCFHRRNRFMVNASSQLICYYDGQPGGTAYTVRYARRHDLRILNLAETQLSLEGFSAGR